MVPAMAEALRAVAAEESSSVAAVARRAIKRALEQDRKEDETSVDMGTSGVARTA